MKKLIILTFLFNSAIAQSKTDSLAYYSKMQNKYLGLAQKEAKKYFKTGNISYSNKSMHYINMSLRYYKLAEDYDKKYP